ncbi:hypothetical protein KIH86_08555 [Paenibacillus sp. HN-1]|uniref:transcription termination/antitermination NusG family protein n=1 Tax=Paenibacillus TaxID=44249 RepID=UPI001CA7CA0A|nr:MULTISPECIES: transcription termination/antitermination NusG family protein [Paenibacillus]MBY9079601.1 hypothetical protein [Paenibacillus sp. CGMCC 1.18879]MBY9084290.1 hypothetical protein [Paenibacillus sinensis]
MGAAFAIQVMTGKELNVKKLMEWAFSKSETAQNWIKAIHTFTESTYRILSDGSIGKGIQRAVMPGYIFLEMVYGVDENNQSAYIPAEVWHLIKSIPGVIKQFTQSGQVIGADEFRKMLGLDLEEQVEVIVPVQETPNGKEQLKENENEVAAALHKMNTANTREEREEAEQVLNKAEGEHKKLLEIEYEESTGEVEVAVKEVGRNSLTCKIKSFLRNMKEHVRFSKALMEKIILQNKQPDKLTSEFVFTELIHYIRNSGENGIFTGAS